MALFLINYKYLSLKTSLLLRIFLMFTAKMETIWHIPLNTNTKYSRKGKKGIYQRRKHLSFPVTELVIS
jgi:hypothetical protein